MKSVVDPGQVILDEITALEVEPARVEARIAARMLDFHDLRRRQAEANTDPRRRDLEESFAADELGFALHQPTRTAQCRLAEARRVRGMLPLTWLAFGAGTVDAYRVSLIASAVEKMRGDNHAVIELDHVVSGKAGKQTTAQLKGWLKRFVARHATGDRPARTEHAKRSVWVNHQDDGMSYLSAYLATSEAVRIDQMLTVGAKKLPADDRTLDNKRAVRELATEPGTLFHRILTDPLGHILDITELGRFPSPKLRIAVDIRDGTCRFPTCSRPAMDSDLDHRIPHPRGRIHVRRQPLRPVPTAPQHEDSWHHRTDRPRHAGRGTIQGGARSGHVRRPSAVRGLNG